MDNIDLKKIWMNNRDTAISEQQLDVLLKKKSEGILSTITKRMKGENFINYTFTVLSIGYTAFVDFSWVNVAFCLSLVIITLYYQRLYKRFLNTNFADNTLGFLRHLEIEFSKFLRTYTIVSYFLGACGFLLGYFYFSESKSDQSQDDLLMQFISLAIAIFILVILFQLIIYLIYGGLLKKIRRLRQSFEEIK